MFRGKWGKGTPPLHGRIRRLDRSKASKWKHALFRCCSGRNAYDRKTLRCVLAAAARGRRQRRELKKEMLL